MDEVKVGPEVLDPSEYWAAIDRIQELKAIPKDEITDVHREQYAASIEVVDAHSQLIRDGGSTGWNTLDNLMYSGQIISRDQLEELREMEARLVIGEPVLFQDGKSWKVGIVVHDELYFSRVHRNSFFAPAAEGHPAVPVRNYVDILFSPSIGAAHGNKTMNLLTVSPEDVLPETGAGVGLPLVQKWGYYRFEEGKCPIPPGLYESWKSYDDTNGWPINEHGGRDYRGILHAGREAVESNLGMTLEELLEFTDNETLLEYVTRPS